MMSHVVVQTGQVRIGSKVNRSRARAMTRYVGTGPTLACAPFQPKLLLTFTVVSALKGK